MLPGRYLPWSEGFGPHPRVVHQVLTASGVCTVCAIRLAAPFTASDATVPIRCPYTSAVIAIEACPSSLLTTAMSAPEAILAELPGQQCRDREVCQRHRAEPGLGQLGFICKAALPECMK